ncbi:hypothetical protein CC78DRAFT_536026 [Lojkania enalia]|uniref:Uncharacterized protein n=1 Tax=Lojkania enalia TaxID=147567 RepID=A0A9P4N051_9PLEO|nr:hypothetical protein CC78DRAFT_536026 [Didymosphaeria enalia]
MVSANDTLSTASSVLEIRDSRPLTRHKPWTLDALPSEIRRLIVSHLTLDWPYQTRYTKGAKIHLKNANLAHRCLREWVPGFLFRDMVLTHVLPGIVSQLQAFSVDPAAAALLRHVRSIQVQVPPAIRWEIRTTDPFDFIDDITNNRLTKKFSVKDPNEMSLEQQEYCSNYHQALVEPFTDNRTWHRLLNSAIHFWPQIFTRFPNLRHIGVGVCERVDHPASTYTNLFIQEHGREVIHEVNPPYVEDATVNLAWASSIVLQSAPPSVSSLQLSATHNDNLSSFANVNRLLGMVYRSTAFLTDTRLVNIKNCTISIKGVAGTHGAKNWHGDTGSAGMVRYWRKVLSAMPNLTHLTLRLDVEGRDLRFTNLEDSDPNGCILEWLLTDLNLDGLKELVLSDFLLRTDTINKIIGENTPTLTKLVLYHAKISLLEPNADFTFRDEQYLNGAGWLGVCRGLTAKMPNLKCELIRPTSSLENLVFFPVGFEYMSKLLSQPGVMMYTQAKYTKDMFC